MDGAPLDRLERLQAVAKLGHLLHCSFTFALINLLFTLLRSHQVHMRGLLSQYADLDYSESPLDGVRDE